MNKKEYPMKSRKIVPLLSVLFTLVAINFLVTTVPAQKPLPKCKAVADQIYFVDSGQQVTDLHPGGNGYQLNILGAGANKFTVVKESYMTSVSLVANYTNDTQAKWQIYFNPRMGQELRKVRMQSECTGRLVSDYPLTVAVVLRDQ
jgi:hypothetical protein